MRGRVATPTTASRTSVINIPIQHCPLPDPLPDPLRIALIAPARSPIAQPFAGGLEAHVWTIAHALRDRGHDVTLYAGPGSDPELKPVELAVDTSWLSLDARRDVSMRPDLVVGEHHAYLSLMLQLAGTHEVDVVHNHSSHYLPVSMAPALRVPMLTTLHTPPTPWLESAVLATAAAPENFAAVSTHTAAAWSHVLDGVGVVPNGIDTDRWPMGEGGGPLVWSGRIVPEKGLHLAIDAAHVTGLPLLIAGPIVDRPYFAQHIAPRLGSAARYVGHLDQDELASLVRGARVALVTPAWEEPYGMVVAEALSSGTPVAAFERGGIPEIVDDTCARLARPGDVEDLAAAVVDAARLDRSAARRRAEQHCSVTVMIARYEARLSALATAAVAP